MKTITKSHSTNSLSSTYSDCSDTVEKKVYLIYNENNILVTRNIIQKILKKSTGVFFSSYTFYVNKI